MYASLCDLIMIKTPGHQIFCSFVCSLRSWVPEALQPDTTVEGNK